MKVVVSASDDCILGFTMIGRRPAKFWLSSRPR